GRTVLSHVSACAGTGTPTVHSLSLHDALPISGSRCRGVSQSAGCAVRCSHVRLDLAMAAAHRALWFTGADEAAALSGDVSGPLGDRKSTRLNSSHVKSSYAVLCLKNKNTCAQT